MMKLKPLIGLFSLGIAVTAYGESIKKLTKPNIVVIIAHDHGYYHMSPYGNTGISAGNY